MAKKKLKPEIEEPKRGPGRPKVEINWDRVGELLEAGATAEGIAALIGCDRDTLYIRSQADLNRGFSALSQEKKAKGEEMLREKQHKLALDGDRTMLIWLGKQRLGQKDRQEMVKIQDLRLVELRNKIEMRAKEKSISYETELQNFLTSFADDVQSDIRERLSSELEM